MAANVNCIIPDTLLYVGCARKVEIEKAMDFLDDMISKGHDPDIVTYNTL